MSQIQHSIVGSSEDQFVTVFVPGADQPLVAGSDHPNFGKIISALTDPETVREERDLWYGPDYDEYVTGLFDTAKTVARKFNALSERVSVANGVIFLDGEEIHNSLATQILRFLDEGVDDWQPLVNFFEKLLANPQEHSRDQLYEWLTRYDVTLADNGDIVFYKGVRKEPDGSLVSVTAGPAIVDGEEVNGNVPNEVGSIIEMARGEVHHDPAQGCSRGLHVANWRYANEWAQGATLEVHVNPRDVVSVPTDCNYEKVRCCRYKVVRVLDAPYSSAILPVDGADDDDEKFIDVTFSSDESVQPDVCPVCDDPDCNYR